MSWRVMPSRSTILCDSGANRKWKVIACPDGDTVLIAGGPHRQAREWLRLLCIDAAEHGQIGFAEARDALQQKILNRYVTLESEKIGKWRRDLYGRTLVYVIDQGVLINAEMVREGWSDYFTRYGRGRYQAIFQRCVAHAVEFRRGVWEFYEPGDNWRWGRGRARAHFRTAQEVIERVKKFTENGGLKNGEIFADPGSVKRRYIGDSVLEKQGGPVC